MTQAQTKALVALSMLGGDKYHRRFSLAKIARGQWGPAYPMKTMLKLQGLGYAEPESEFVVKLVEAKRCRCGCDAWRITSKGQAFVDDLNVKCTTR